MKKIIVPIIVIGLLISISMVSINALEIECDISEELELTVNPNAEPFDGYILYTPWSDRKTYLINNTGEVVHKWSSLHNNALPVYLLD